MHSESMTEQDIETQFPVFDLSSYSRRIFPSTPELEDTSKVLHLFLFLHL